MSLPPFLIMKDEGEVWQLATAVNNTADVAEEANEHSYAPAGPAMEVAVLASEGVSLLGNTSSGGSQVSQAKNAKLSGALNKVDALISSSPDLYHKLPIRSNNQDSEVSEALKDNEDSEGSEEDSVKSNLFVVKYIMWFEI